jgi:hypothetical protein
VTVGADSDSSSDSYSSSDSDSVDVDPIGTPVTPIRPVAVTPISNDNDNDNGVCPCNASGLEALKTNLTSAIHQLVRERE